MCLVAFLYFIILRILYYLYISMILNINDIKWCNLLNINQVYGDFPVNLSTFIHQYDNPAFKDNEKYHFVYDKLFIMKSQDVPSGELNRKHVDEINTDYPIFIKPRWGHTSAGSKDCYKIKDIDQLSRYVDKPNMMWSSFINANESMTDFVMQDGKILYQLTYEYSPKQNEFADDWKYISPQTQAPKKIVEWVHKHLPDYTGPLNIQYRDDIIIEVSLRFARRATYLKSTGNTELIENINNTIGNPLHREWNYSSDTSFRPYYSFKCWSPMNLFYILPNKVMELITQCTGCKKFFEYYFEPTGKNGTVFFQFQHHNFKAGMKIKHFIESLTILCNMFFIIMFFICMFAIHQPKTNSLGYHMLGLLLILYLTLFLNSYHHFSKIFRIV